MNFADWYTDRADVFRIVQTKEGNLTRSRREPVYRDIPCRVYRSGEKPITMEQTAAKIQQEDKLMLDNTWDIREGDELRIRRGAGLGKEVFAIRAFAGEPARYFEPFGAVIPGLAHQEIDLLQQERVDALELHGEPATEDSTA